MGEGTRPRYPRRWGAAANGWRGLPSKMLLLCPPRGKGPGVLPTTGSPRVQDPQGRVPRWQRRGAGPLPAGARLRGGGGQGDTHTLVSTGNRQHRHCAWCRGVGRKARGNAGLGCRRKVCTDTAPPAGRSLPLHITGLCVINSEADYSRKTYPGLPGALHHCGVLHHVTG